MRKRKPSFQVFLLFKSLTIPWTKIVIKTLFLIFDDVIELEFG